ncbi:MAG: 5-dehydro-2-deoxygluconokinase [Planctomycetota bacterium]
MHTRAHQPLCIGLGEVLWDLLPGGREPGGAPANFAWHARQLGAEGRIVSAVGCDAEGDALLAELERRGLPTDGIGRSALPTGSVTVQLDAAGTPSYRIREEVAWDRLWPGPEAEALVARAEALCFGSLAQRTHAGGHALRALVTACRGLRVFDCNLRQHHWDRQGLEASLQLAHVLKLNDEELAVLTPLLGLGRDAHGAMQELAARHGLRGVALTRASGGSSLLLDGSLVVQGPTSVDVVDTVGAGDAWCAALALGILRGHDPARIAAHCHEVASFTCTRRGAMVQLPASLRA